MKFDSEPLSRHNPDGIGTEELVRQLEESEVLVSENIKDAFLKVDRADFVPENMKGYAYIDQPLPIGEEQTISQPTVVAFMLELLQPQEGDKIMDVGVGSGWQTALLAEIVGDKGQIDAVEVIPQLLQWAKKNLKKYNFENIAFFRQNAKGGLPKKAPFDGIIAGAAGKEVPPAWKEQLKVGGRIVVPIGTSVFLYTKKATDKFAIQEYSGFAFVPLV